MQPFQAKALSSITFITPDCHPEPAYRQAGLSKEVWGNKQTKTLGL